MSEVQFNFFSYYENDFLDDFFMILRYIKKISDDVWVWARPQPVMETFLICHILGPKSVELLKMSCPVLMSRY
jgi:hypothetical protein